MRSTGSTTLPISTGVTMRGLIAAPPAGGWGRCRRFSLRRGGARIGRGAAPPAGGGAGPGGAFLGGGGGRRGGAVALPAGGGGGGAGGGARDGAAPWTAMRRERPGPGARALQVRRPPETPRPPVWFPQRLRRVRRAGRPVRAASRAPGEAGRVRRHP